MTTIREVYVRTLEEQRRYVDFFHAYGADVTVHVEYDHWLPLPAVLTETNLYRGRTSVGRVILSFLSQADAQACAEIVYSMPSDSREMFDRTFAMTSEDLGKAALESVRKRD